MEKGAEPGVASSGNDKKCVKPLGRVRLPRYVVSPHMEAAPHLSSVSETWMNFYDWPGGIQVSFIIYATLSQEKWSLQNVT